jgi:hypothetical protein
MKSATNLNFFVFILLVVFHISFSEKIFNMVINQKKINNVIRQSDKSFFFKFHKFKTTKTIFSNIKQVQGIQFEAPNSNDISEFSSILKIYQKQCKKGEFFVYMNGDDNFIRNTMFHILLLQQFMSENLKYIFGINFGYQMSGLMFPCQNFEKFILYLDSKCQLSNISVEKCLNQWKESERKIYTYRYQLISKDKTRHFHHELKTSQGFNSFQCPLEMLSPCNQKELKLRKHFSFRDEQLIATNLGITHQFRDKFIQKNGISLHFADGRYPCKFQCESSRKRCHSSLYLFVNDCDFMLHLKDAKISPEAPSPTVQNCTKCLNHDEGKDQPFIHQGVCRLRSFYGFSCREHAASTIKVCACF